MSGGHFYNNKWGIESIAEEIEWLIKTNDSDDVVNEFGDPRGRHYGPETIAEFKAAVELLRKAFVYAHRIDYLISGDNGEDSFHEELHTDLERLK